MFISTAWAQGAGGGGGGDIFSALLPLVLIFGVFYFLLIRPQQKKVKQHKELLGQLRRGDRIVTGGGIYGTITKVISDAEVAVEIAEGVKVRIARGTIADVVSKPEPVKADNKPAGEAAAANQSVSDKVGGFFGKFGK